MIARRELVTKLLENRGELLVIAGLGSTAWDVTAAGDSPLNFPMWGAMGQAAMMGLVLGSLSPSQSGAWSSSPATGRCSWVSARSQRSAFRNPRI